MKAEEAKRYMESFPPFNPKALLSGGRKLELETIRELLRHLGNPERQLKAVHIAGTNGKGSVLTFLQSVLTAAGYRVGVFSSPALEEMTEQIRIDANEISYDEIGELLEEIRDAASHMQNKPSGFETWTALALLYFVKKKCDLVILEAGLGGKTDATNVIPTPLLAVITKLGMDHTELLGNTIEEIAFQKAGIIKQGGTVLLYPEIRESALQVIQKACKETASVLHIAPAARRVCSSLQAQHFFYPLQMDGASMQVCFEIALLGTYQIQNAAVAIRAVELLSGFGFSVSQEQISLGLKRARWKGRFEVFKKKNRYVIIDGSHNADGIAGLKESLQCHFPDQPVVFVAGVLADKAYTEMFSSLLPLAAAIYTVTPDSPRALSGKQLKEALCTLAKKNGYPDIRIQNAGSMEQAVSLAYGEEAGVICISGTLYDVKAARAVVDGI